MTAAAVLAWLVKHEDLLGWASCLLGAVLLVGVTHHKDAVIARGRAATVQAQAQTHVAEAQGQLSTAAAAIPAAADRRAVDITVHTEEAAHAVETAPGASALVPPDVLAGWAAGVDGLRNEAAAAHAGPADPGGGQSAPAVPAPGASRQP